MTSKPTAREKFENVKLAQEGFTKKEEFLISLVEAAVNCNIVSSRASTLRKLEKGEYRLVFEPVDENKVWKEIDQRMAEGKK